MFAEVLGPRPLITLLAYFLDLDQNLWVCFSSVGINRAV